MTKIKLIKAREIIDSRGNPTVEADIFLENGAFGRASVPSGASTGSLEACELRDNDPRRFCGKGVLRAVSNIENQISSKLFGIDALDQKIVDQVMIDLDGTENKSRLGANAILAVSLANARAAAANCKQPLYQYLSSSDIKHMPIPMMNVINGGAHADNLIEFQEFMIVPLVADSFADRVRIGCEIFHSLKNLLKRAGHSVSVGDEGGFAPNLRTPKEAIEYIIRAIEDAGYHAGSQVAIALDVAASEFFEQDRYSMENRHFTNMEMIDVYKEMIESYPIISIEDPLDEQDHQGWLEITKILGNKTLLVGDDLFVTNEKILHQAIKENIANSILIKPNQIGTLTEMISTIKLAKKNNYKTIMSHRSGETEDNIIAHLAVAYSCDYIKTGSLSRSDRLAKYNELIRIESQ